MKSSSVKFSSVNNKYIKPLLLLSLFMAQFVAHTCLAVDNDPTRPITYKPPATANKNKGGLTLNSLLISKQRKQASINGQSVTEGDRIAGVANTKVITIAADGVTIERNGKRQTLKLNTTTVKRASKRANKN